MCSKNKSIAVNIHYLKHDSDAKHIKIYSKNYIQHIRRDIHKKWLFTVIILLILTMQNYGKQRITQKVYINNIP